MGDYIYSGDHKRLEKKDYENCINKIFDVLKELPEDKHYYASYGWSSFQLEYSALFN